MNEQLIDLKKSLTETRAGLEKQLEDCQSGKFKLYWVGQDGKRVDAMPEQIANLQRVIAEYDRLLTAGVLDA